MLRLLTNHIPSEHDLANNQVAKKLASLLAVSHEDTQENKYRIPYLCEAHPADIFLWM